MLAEQIKCFFLWNAADQSIVKGLYCSRSKRVEQNGHLSKVRAWMQIPNPVFRRFRRVFDVLKVHA